MPKKEPTDITVAKIARASAIFVAIISLFGVVFTIYSQTNKNPTSQVTEYFGRIIDINTLQPISNAKITLDLEGVPPVVYTDSEGIYRFEVEIESKISGQIWVDAVNYQPYTRHITISIESNNLEDIRLSPSIDQPVIPTPTETASLPIQSSTPTPTVIALPPAIQVMDQYYKYINHASIPSDLSRAWDLLTQKLQCNSSDQCKFENYRDFWWGQQVNYRLYDCGSNKVDTELIYYTRNSQPLANKAPVYLRYTLVDDNGQLKVNAGESTNGISAYCTLAVSYP